jgi:glycerol-3-phosphate acyltransferase PlsX
LPPALLGPRAWLSAGLVAVGALLGASLLGLKGLVFKSHGGADVYAFEWAIRRAYDAAKYDVLARIAATMAELMPQGQGRAAETAVVAMEPAAPVSLDQPN